MLRREFLSALPSAAILPALPALDAGACASRPQNYRYPGPPASRRQRPGPSSGKQGDAFDIRIGGGSFTEILTDQGLTGIGPGIDPATLTSAKHELVGKNLLPMEQHITQLGGRGGGGGGPVRGPAAVEIALWDLLGKALGEPLYKLWGGASNRVLPYSSAIGRGVSIEERVDLATRVKAEGWKAIKIRPHWETMKEDIRLVEQVRKAVGDDFMIMCDANQAPGMNDSGITWDFKRAAETGKAYQELGVYWLEEPLERYNLDGLAELNRMFTMMLAGGEGNAGMHEFRDYIIHNCYDILQPELAIVGPSMLLKIAAVAQAFDKKLIPHEGFMSLATICQLHFVAATNAPVGELLNDPPIGDYKNYFSIYENPPLVGKDGYMIMPEGPGLGVEIKRDLIVS